MVVPHILETPVNLRRFLAAMAVMPCELASLIKVVLTTTIRELKAMLHELKHGQDPISKVQVLDKGLLVRGDQTLQSAGLLLQPKRK